MVGSLSQTEKLGKANLLNDGKSKGTHKNPINATDFCCKESIDSFLTGIS